MHVRGDTQAREIVRIQLAVLEVNVLRQMGNVPIRQLYRALPRWRSGVLLH